jgi:hypothetical protein
VTDARSKDKRSVYIDSTDSKSRDVRAEYITPMPAWKSSYRLLLDDVGAQLQAQLNALMEKLDFWFQLKAKSRSTSPYRSWGCPNRCKNPTLNRPYIPYKPRRSPM